MEPLKAVKLLLNERKIDKGIALLTDEIYLQKEVRFQQGKPAAMTVAICLKEL